MGPEWLRGRDPDTVALRRAARVAVTVPLGLVLLERIPAIQDVALFGVFAMLALLTFADFRGPMAERACAYVATVAAAVPCLVVGVFVSGATAAAVAWMATVTLVLGVAAVLRGAIASAQTTILLATVLAVTSAPQGGQWRVAAAWVLGGLIATASALLLWPAHPRDALRRQLTGVYRAASRAVSNRWGDPPADPDKMADVVTALHTSVWHLHERYDGNLMRPAGVNSTDRGLAELIDVADRLDAYQGWIDLRPTSIGREPELAALDGALAHIVAGELATVGAGIAERPPPGGADRIRQARDRHFEGTNAWVARNRRDRGGAELRTHLDQMFPLRLSSASAELAAAIVAGQDHFHDPSLGTLGPQGIAGAGTRVRAQLSWQSPWLRGAVRSAIALGASVGVARSLGLEHSFWIVLGTLTALRFDALGTGRTAMQALLGTSAGVAIGAALVVLFGAGQAVWWVLLPISLFWCAFTPGTFSLGVGQSAFSVAVIVLFSLLYAKSLQTAELRLVDVSIGLGVSLAVSLLMWPRGIVPSLYARMSEALAAAARHLAAALDNLAGGSADDRIVAEHAAHSAAAQLRATEAYDLAVAQQPPRSVPLLEWSRITNATRHVDLSARILPGVRHLIQRRGADRPIPDPVVGPLLDAAADLRLRLQESVETWQHLSDRRAANNAAVVPLAPHRVGPADLPNSVMHLRQAIDDWLSGPDAWTGTGPDPRPTSLAWVSDWVALIAWSAEGLRRDLGGATLTPT